MRHLEGRIGDLERAKCGPGRVVVVCAADEQRLEAVRATLGPADTLVVVHGGYRSAELGDNTGE